MSKVHEQQKQEAVKLLPLGQRVTHFNGGPHTHGKGTIIGYNDIKPNQYVNSGKLGDAVEMASANPLLLDGLVASMYDKSRYPYIVQFDPSIKYPEGYKDVYGLDDVRPE